MTHQPSNISRSLASWGASIAFLNLYSWTAKLSDFRIIERKLGFGRETWSYKAWRVRILGIVGKWHAVKILH